MVQRRFLRELGVSEAAALSDYRLAPLEFRRDMAMLGAFHKVTLGLAPAQLMALFAAKPAGWHERLQACAAARPARPPAAHRGSFSVFKYIASVCLRLSVLF